MVDATSSVRELSVQFLPPPTSSVPVQNSATPNSIPHSLKPKLHALSTEIRRTTNHPNYPILPAQPNQPRQDCLEITASRHEPPLTLLTPRVLKPAGYLSKATEAPTDIYQQTTAVVWVLGGDEIRSTCAFIQLRPLVGIDRTIPYKRREM